MRIMSCLIYLSTSQSNSSSLLLSIKLNTLHLREPAPLNEHKNQASKMCTHPHHRPANNASIVFSHLKTTTTGLSDFVITIRLFHATSAENTIIARLNVWNASCRLLLQSFFTSSICRSTNFTIIELNRLLSPSFAPSLEFDLDAHLLVEQLEDTTSSIDILTIANGLRTKQ